MLDYLFCRDDKKEGTLVLDEGCKMHDNNDKSKWKIVYKLYN